MQVARTVPKTDFTVLAADQYHGKFRLKRHHGFGNQRLPAGAFPRTLYVTITHDPRLALAVIAHADGFEDARNANIRNRGG